MNYGAVNAVLMSKYEDDVFTITMSDGTVLNIDVELDPEHMMSGNLP